MIKLLFKEGKEKAFTTSYDDGVRQDRRLTELMKKYGIRGTFNISTGLLGKVERALIDGYDTDTSKISLAEICAVYAGQEIAAHAHTHPDLTKEEDDKIDEQIRTNREILEREMGELVQGFAYPYGAYDKRVIKRLDANGIRYARTVVSTKEFGLPKDFLLWHPTCHHDEKSLMELAREFCQNPVYSGENGLFYLWGHAYEFDQKKNWNRIEELFAYIKEFDDSIWFATNGEIEACVENYRRLRVSADESKIYNPSSEPVWVNWNGRKRELRPGISEAEQF